MEKKSKKLNKKKIGIIVIVVIVMLCAFSAAYLYIDGYNLSNIVKDMDTSSYIYQSNNSSTLLLYIGDTHPSDVVREINHIMDDGFEYVGSYTTKLDYDSYANECYLLFRKTSR